MDDGAGTLALDSSGKGLHGLLVNGPIWEPAGLIGGALRFDGVDDGLKLSTVASRLMRTRGTMAFWIKLTTLTATNDYLFSARGTLPPTTHRCTCRPSAGSG